MLRHWPYLVARFLIGQCLHSPARWPPLLKQAVFKCNGNCLFLIWVHNHSASSLKSSEFISQLRDLLNTVDLSDISVDEQNKSQANKEQPCASQHLEMPMIPRNKTSSSVAMTSPYSGNLKRAKNKNVSPNLKEISEKEDLDTVKFRILMLYNHDVIRLQQKPNISSTRFSGLPTLVTEHAWYCGMSNT